MKNKPRAWIHFVILGILIVYLIIAPIIEMRYFLTEGKSVKLSGELPESVEQIRYAVDKMDEVTLHGERVYKIWGWSFLAEEPDQSKYDIFLVLRSGRKAFFFPATPSRRTDLNKAFPDAGIDLLYSGFHTYIAQDTLNGRNYQIGFLYVDKASGERYYQSTTKRIIRTPNTLILGTMERGE